jgi:hypothetical protein
MGSRLTTGMLIASSLVSRDDLKQGVCRSHRRTETGAASSQSTSAQIYGTSGSFIGHSRNRALAPGDH